MRFTRAAAAAFASSAALAMVFASTGVVADGTDSDHDGIPDSLEDATQRTVAATTRGDEFSVSSILVSGGLEDQFELTYEAGKFEVWYSRPGGVSSSYQIRLKNLVEWKDFNGNHTIDDGEVFATIPLGREAFGDVPVLASNRSDPDGGRVFDFNVLDRTGNITLDVTVARRFMRVDNVVLTPMEARMDISIRPDIAPPGASLGIEIQMDTDHRVLFEDQSWDEVHQWAPSERSVNVTAEEGDESATVFFSWANNAIADGRSIPVSLTTGPPQSPSYELYFAYPLGPTPPTTRIVHRTSLGVLSVVYEIRQRVGPEIQGDFLLYAASLVGVAGLVGGTIVLADHRRQRRQDEGRKP